jgi:hypothetical protein
LLCSTAVAPFAEAGYVRDTDHGGVSSARELGIELGRYKAPNIACRFSLSCAS